MKKAAIPARTFRDAVKLFLGEGDTSGEISLAGFLAEHGFVDPSPSLGSIGSLPRSEALALNALVSPEATFVLLECESPAGQRSHAAELISEIEALGFEVRSQFADLTLPGRWPQILTAMARTNVGIVGIDAKWASSEPNFWTTLQQFLKSGKSLVFIRHLLDFRNTQFLLPLIRSMPAHWEQNVIATTPKSIWFASDAESGSNMRHILRVSGLFPEDNTDLGVDRPDRPVIVCNENSLKMIDVTGRFPRVVYLTNNAHRTGIDYKSGWSNPESDGCWTTDHDSVIKLGLPSSMSRTPIAISVSGNSWIAPDKTEQILELGLGNEPAQWIETSFSDSDEILTTAVDCANVKRDSSEIVIRFHVHTPGRPCDYGGTDTRLLGFKCRSISVFT
jgi:hypothetical protein